MAGKLIVTVLPSFGERYLYDIKSWKIEKTIRSSPLYASIRDETAAMTHMETFEENLKRLNGSQAKQNVPDIWEKNGLDFL